MEINKKDTINNFMHFVLYFDCSQLILILVHCQSKVFCEKQYLETFKYFFQN